MTDSIETTEVDRLSDFSRDISHVINRYSMENASGTPDFILGDLLTSVLASFNDAIQKRSEWRGESVELPVTEASVEAVRKFVKMGGISEETETGKTHFQKTLDDITDEQIKWRSNYIVYLMSNPGFLATYGDDFVVEYGDMQLSQFDDPADVKLNQYRVTFSQEVKFYRREFWEKIQEANNLGLADRIRELRTIIKAGKLSNTTEVLHRAENELQTLLEDLEDLGLRITPNGNLESA